MTEKIVSPKCACVVVLCRALWAQRCIQCNQHLPWSLSNKCRDSHYNIIILYGKNMESCCSRPCLLKLFSYSEKIRFTNYVWFDHNHHDGTKMFIEWFASWAGGPVFNRIMDSFQMVLDYSLLSDQHNIGLTYLPTQNLDYVMKWTCNF